VSAQFISTIQKKRRPESVSEARTRFSLSESRLKILKLFFESVLPSVTYFLKLIALPAGPKAQIALIYVSISCYL